ncbi:helix-turn-helix transcriptional regulator [Acerihabitans sp. TG2]|uniref:helix-turn-helix domain-containing protein n=1 Tax=Acerihabitans sp. TG2 TaxID=3096008 RepID=UPI002B2383CC|nr:helix-turn-helix transcriptional regulator [Acerihabitans sp. TG2]MEA9389422.1 helix-turn-helix transcriptional regulator [Acerihabitans sp. TG2]
MKFNTMSDSEIIADLCCRIKDARIEQRLSQIDLAERSGLGIATIKRAEMGGSVTLSTLICILRGLNRLHQLEGVLFDTEVRAFNAQISGERQNTPLRIRKRAVITADETEKPLLDKKVDPTAVDWYISAAENNVIW